MKVEQSLATLFEVLTFIGALVGGIFVAGAFLPSMSAPQGTESVAIGLAFTIIPYCLAGIFHRGAMRGLMRDPRRTD